MEKIVLEKNDSNQDLLLKFVNACEILLKTKMQVTNKDCKEKLTGCFDLLFEMSKKPNWDDILSEVCFANKIIDSANRIMKSYSLKEVVLKSTHPEEYDDLVVVCKIIPNDKIGEYLEGRPESKKFYAHKNGVVSARIGVPGEIITTTLKTIVDGKEYILSEEENVVKKRNVDGEFHSDVVVRNLDSTSAEQYVVKHSKFCETYVPYVLGTQCSCGKSARYVPVVDSRLLTQVSENVIIMTSWGAPAVCLAGSYIVTYNAEENDYNTIECGAFKSTYVREEQPTKKLRDK